MARLLKIVSASELAGVRRSPVDAPTLAAAASIVDDVRTGGGAALRAFAERFGDVEAGGALVIERDELDRALASLDAASRSVLERAAGRIRVFAEAQRASVRDVEVPVPGGVGGQSVAPVERAGCYAPGGRYPLPSSVLMTAVTARAAGVEDVTVASPRAGVVTLAAAAVAGADRVLCAGGAQAIAAMAHGVDGVLGACDVIVGPGNRWVTAAKQLVAGFVRIDMLAGPSELVVLADGGADAGTVAADLLAQAEHDDDASAVLVTTDAGLADAVERELRAQLASLPTRATAERALGNGFCVLVRDLNEGVDVCDRLAPEHLELLVENADALRPRLRHYGGLFVGSAAAEVLGDYGIGPNHTLPTGGTARSSGGLSVFDFLRVRTWLRVDDAAGARGAIEDAAALACLEGLEGHARSALRRL
ncbi:MAG: histidinol dehydrogenase [Phycisphaerales bacterium]|nr:MAG: histidinol dehydrogenase [Phycisphaerales bacterium]